MAWYCGNGEARDVIVSSRVRFARNVERIPFGKRLSDDDAEKLISGAGEVLGEKYTRVNFDELSPVTAQAYVEEHIVSSEFASGEGKRALYKNDDDEIYVMVCEEDHFRVQSIKSGLSLDSAYSAAKEAAGRLSEKFEIAFDPELGYLTHCPTNLGTAMRASVMVFLPAITKCNGIPSLTRQLSKLGFTVRGMYGEGSDALGTLYQISNQETLGITEEETVKRLSEVANSVVNEERRLRRELMSGDAGDETADRCMRAYGILKHSRAISNREFLSLWIEVRLGVAISDDGGERLIPENVTYDVLDALMIEVQPAVLTLLSGGGELSPHDRDLRRAKILAERL
ncbi:MAG: ATP--guanido phosphotransferase [Firmicutes bacterium]|nr:ATP--guanido phosphotransferase [Bacillota bacterium]